MIVVGPTTVNQQGPFIKKKGDANLFHCVFSLWCSLLQDGNIRIAKFHSRPLFLDFDRRADAVARSELVSGDSRAASKPARDRTGSGCRV